jgi:hypothetical protein
MDASSTSRTRRRSPPSSSFLRQFRTFRPTAFRIPSWVTPSSATEITVFVITSILIKFIAEWDCYYLLATYFPFRECPETTEIVDIPEKDVTVRLDPGVGFESIGPRINTEAETMRLVVGHQQCAACERPVKTIVGAREIRRRCQNRPAD